MSQDLPPTPIGQLSRNQKEFKLQVHIVKQHEKYFPHVLMTAFPGRPGDAQDGFFKRMMGVRAGVLDIIIWYTFPYPSWATMWLGKMLKHCGFSFARMHNAVIEIKVDARVSSSQNKFMSAIRSMGGYEGVAYSWKDYYKLLCSWGIKPVCQLFYFDEPDYRDLGQKYQDAHLMYKPVARESQPPVGDVGEGFSF